MGNKKQLQKLLVSIILLGASMQIVEAAGGRQMITTKVTSPPIGHVRFCNRLPHECLNAPSRSPIVGLTRNRWDELVAVNDHVNMAIQPVTDQDLYKVAEYWAFPASRGDCEDYALLKRRLLIAQGWPAGALLITVVREANGNGHAVLTVRTDQGDLILDNQRPGITHWYQTPYRYVKRQSETHSGQWKKIVDRRSKKTLQLAERN